METFRFHLMAMERYVSEERLFRLPGDKSVYLAGMIARQTDPSSKAQTEDFLIEGPEQLDIFVRMHDPYIGQNAPIVTVSRINAERITLDLAHKRRSAYSFELRFAARLFGLASHYSYLAGNRTLGDIFYFLRNHFPSVLRLLQGYLAFLAQHPERLQDSLEIASKAMWERLGRERNERNQKKESWEKMGINLKKKAMISPAELGGMINFTSENQGSSGDFLRLHPFSELLYFYAPEDNGRKSKAYKKIPQRKGRCVEDAV